MKHAIVTAAFIGALVLSGCQQAGDDPNALSGLVTPEGVKAESFFPTNTFMVFKLGSADAEQLNHLRTLASYFPQGVWEMAMTDIAKGFNEDFAPLNATFEDDLLPAIGDSAQAIAGFSGTVTPEEDPDILVVLSVADPLVFRSWMDQAAEKGHGQKQNYKSYGIYSGPGQESYITPYKDVLLVSNRVKGLKQALDRAEARSVSLLSNASYQKGLATMPNALGYFFLDPRFAADVMENDPEAREEMGDVQEDVKKLIRAIEGEFFAFAAEPEGIRISGTIYGDPQKWAELGDMANFDVQPSYLYKKLPADGVLFYGENYDLQTGLKTTMAMYRNMEEFRDGVKMIEGALAAQGIDLEKDILSFMDKGYAFGLYDAGSLLPAMGLFIDASSNRAGAEKVMAQLFVAIEGILKDAPADLLPFITHESSATKNGDDNALVFDISALPDETKEGAFPEELRNERLEFHYGLDTDGTAYFAFYPGYDDRAFTVLGEDEAFVQALATIEGFDRSVSYIDVGGVMAYVDRIVDFAARIEGGSSSDLADYQLFRSYMAPVKSLILAGGPSGEGELKLGGFLRIQPVDR